MKKQTLAFYVKATVKYVESTKRGRSFNYTDIHLFDCLVSVSGSTATIYKSNGIIIEKRTYGKYFYFAGREVKEATFKKHLRILKTRLQNEKHEKELQAQALRERAEKETEELKKVIIAYIDKNKPDWRSNEGNSHTRRTRWGNRAARIFGDRKNYTLVRNVYFEVIDQNPDFFVNGKYNLNHA